MAYNSFYPATYQPYFNGYQQPIQQPQILQNPQQLNQQQAQQQQQIQNGGFIPVPSEDYARNYPVAPGNSVTFKDEKQPYVYTKTMGFSSLDRPVFEKFRLVKEEEYLPENAPKTDEKKMDIDMSVYALKSDLDALAAQVTQLSATVEKLTAKPAKKGAKDDE